MAKETQRKYVIESRLATDMGLNENKNGSAYPAVFGKILETLIEHSADPSFVEDFAVFGLMDLRQKKQR